MKGATTQINNIYGVSHKRYGSPRIREQLRRGGVVVSRKTVAKYMHQMGIQSVARKKYHVCTTDSNHHYLVNDNKLCRDFIAHTTGLNWVGDLMYVKTAQGWLYLSIVMDLADRKIIGWAMSETIRADVTTVAALKMAFQNRKTKKNLYCSIPTEVCNMPANPFGIY